MTTIIFFSAELRDTQAPGHTLRLEAGRGGDPELFWLSNGSKYVSLDHVQAAEFLGALAKMDRSVRAGKLTDQVFYSGDIQSFDGKSLGVDLGVQVGRPYVQRRGRADRH